MNMLQIKVPMTRIFSIIVLERAFQMMKNGNREWASGPLHSNWKIRVFLLQEVFFPLVVQSVGVNENGHYKAQAQESLLNFGATNKAFFILGR